MYTKVFFDCWFEYYYLHICYKLPIHGEWLQLKTPGYNISLINIFGAALWMYIASIASGEEAFCDVCFKCVNLKKACTNQAHIIGPWYNWCGNICDSHSFKLIQ